MFTNFNNVLTLKMFTNFNNVITLNQEYKSILTVFFQIAKIKMYNL
jgi:hypothetical protein